MQVWNDANNAQRYDGSCPIRACPDNAGGHPNCECNKGYSGTISWISSSQTYIGSCTKIDCPPGSTNHPDCQCSPGYAGQDGGDIFLEWDFTAQYYTEACEDVNECADPNTCGLGVGCHNIQGSYECALVPVALQLPYTIPSTDGGSVLRFSVAGSFPIVQEVSYGSSNSPGYYSCTSFSYNQADQLVSCTLAPSLGVNLSFTLGSCSSNMVTCDTQSFDFSNPDNFFSMPAPFITPNTLKEFGGNETTHLSFDDNIGRRIQFRGGNFGFDTVLDQERLSVTFSSLYNKFSCNLLPETTHDTIACITKSFAVGSEMVFTVVAGSQRVVGTDKISFPIGATITSVSGCPGDEGNILTLRPFYRVGLCALLCSFSVEEIMLKSIHLLLEGSV